MLTADIKQRINTARDILVGKIPSPTGQIEQITNALIYKFMSDQDNNSLKLGGKATCFTDELLYNDKYKDGYRLSDYSWDQIFSSRNNNQQKADIYREGLELLSTSSHLPDFFRDVFKNAYLPFRDADTICLFLAEIDKFEYASDDLGNAFEYLLQIMGSQGDAGQFRTPRNIIEFIVNLVDPTKEETILDPACGTAGFLVEAYKHISEHTDLTSIDKVKLSSHLKGVDIDPGMAKIARVNLYLHGFKTPSIEENDTLTNENLWGNTSYDIILANPPFMTPKGGIKPHKKFSLKSNRAEVLFVDYIIEHLRLNGRAGIVVPEGIIFQSSNAYKQLRKKLVDEGYLHAVVSLPSGVFQPYSGVKTSILVIDREKARESENILFIKVENDGYDLGAQRRKIEKNDLPKALEIYEQWKEGKLPQTQLAYTVSKTKLAEDGDYNLTGDRYRETVDYSNSNWPIVNISEYCFIQEGPGIRKYEYDDSVEGYPIINVRCVQNGYIDMSSSRKANRELATGKWLHFQCQENDILFTTSGTIGRVAKVTKYDLPLLMNTSVVRFRSDNEKLNNDFLKLILKSDYIIQNLKNQSTGNTIQNVGPSHIKKLMIPLPPLEVQEDIVREIEGYQNVIDGCNQVIKNWKPTIKPKKEWSETSVFEVAEIKSKLINPQDEKHINSIHIGAGNIISESNHLINLKSSQEEGLISGKFEFDSNTILYSKIRPYLKKVVMPNFNGICSADIYPIVCNSNKIKKEFLYYILLGDKFTKYAIAGSSRVGMPKVNRDHFFKYTFKLPPIEEQQKIVDEIESERAVVEANKELAEKMQTKITQTLATLWEE